jgi:hypothetical protein
VRRVVNRTCSGRATPPGRALYAALQGRTQRARRALKRRAPSILSPLSPRHVRSRAKRACACARGGRGAGVGRRRRRRAARARRRGVAEQPGDRVRAARLASAGPCVRGHAAAAAHLCVPTCARAPRCGGMGTLAAGRCCRAGAACGGHGRVVTAGPDPHALADAPRHARPAPARGGGTPSARAPARPTRREPHPQLAPRAKT